MATLALSFAGQAIGAAVGGPVGALVGRTLGALAGNAIDQALFAEPHQQTGSDIRLQGSQEGGVVPRVYGWSRIAGNIVWATELERLSSQSSGAKGTGGSEDEIVANFAIALCEGEVAHMGRIWADGRVLDTEGLTIRFYAGSETQSADPLIVAKQGVEATPAYRGTCYVVFEALPLGEFGNRIPNISVEICRVVGELEPAITAITLIPGATEFGYDPQPRMRIAGPGVTAPENAHDTATTSDWTVSLDELQALCPNLKHVSLVVAWFGTDLRAGQCDVEPRVESTNRSVSGASWSVSGLNRAAANPVSTVDGGPAYGGTPSDAAVLAAIADLKARGLKVTLSPFMLMDVPSGNGLGDPYGGAEQAAFPWRGRVTCDPAPGLAGTVDQTAAAATQVSGFLGTAAPSDFATGSGVVVYSGPNEWRFRRFVLHYAALASLAGGVDAFVIGSEMRGLSTVRSAAETFPFVDELVALAADVRTIVGSTSRITYAADWSEYSGYQPAGAPGDKLFHLDPLWASADIDAIGIDNYMPLADWRDGTGHADAGFGTIHNRDYLDSNIAGGEGFDWYYATDADRYAQLRTPITDGAYSEPWVWRVKDFVNWWGNPHHNRVGGVRAPIPTGWVAESKPLWLMELGCGAVDKGANLPSAFADPKSSENARPWFSSGASDALMQRQLLRAHLRHWRDTAPGFDDSFNPQSSLYSGRMLDAERIYLWTWDARPFPAFPALADIWADAGNHATGHWLAGRLGALASDELLGAMAADWGVAPIGAEAAGSLVSGLTIGSDTGLRAASDTIAAACGLTMRDGPEGLALFRPESGPAKSVTLDQLISPDGPVVVEKRHAPGEVPRQIALGFGDRLRDYNRATVSASAIDGSGFATVESGLTLDLAAAGTIAATLLGRARAVDDGIELALPLSELAFEPGDRIALDGVGDLIVSEIRDTDMRRISAKPLRADVPVSLLANGRVLASGAASAASLPELVVAHLPPDPEAGGNTRLVLGAFASPWPGTVRVVTTTTGATLAELTKAATIGELTADLSPAPAAIWDNANSLDVALYAGLLASASRLETLNGTNRVLVQRDDGGWELIGFQTAELIGTDLYRLSGLLRGLQGTGSNPTASIGARVLLVDDAIASAGLGSAQLGSDLGLKAFVGSKDATGTAWTAAIDAALAKPLAPVHLASARDPVTGDVTLTWVRRSRLGGDSWTLADMPLDVSSESYRIEVGDGVSTLRTLTSTVPTVTYSATEQTADFGALPASFTFDIAQLSAIYGAGAAATGVFND